MIKKCSILMILLFILIRPLSIFADVLIEPDDSFYKRHSDECTSERKYYITENDVEILESPDSWKGFSEAPTGSVFYISWIYTDKNGHQWGLYDGVDVSYWVDMKSLKPLYSHQEFSIEHAQKIINEDITFIPDQKGYVILYEYPGSTWISDILDTEWIDEGSFTVHQVYVDENNQKWGYMPYYRQHNGWINLDDAITETEPQRVAPQIFIPEESPFPSVLIACLVAGLCVLTGTITFLKKNKNL